MGFDRSFKEQTELPNGLKSAERLEYQKLLTSVHMPQLLSPKGGFKKILYFMAKLIDG